MNLTINSISSFFFVGIAGTGMSAIAQYLSNIGKNVAGSDRLFADETSKNIKNQFSQIGIKCFNQDASGLTKDYDVLVISTAIEPTNIEYIKAEELGIKILKRSELLALISSSKRTIAVGGTSGKSTTTAMIFHILQKCNFEPSLITGAGLSSLQKKGLLGNSWVGTGEWLVIEADESDGSIVNYKPEISVLLNIDRDHHEFDKLMELFALFKANTSQAFIVNRDDKRAINLSMNEQYDFAYHNSAAIKGANFYQNGFEISFDVNGIKTTVPAIGKHNMENALAAISVCTQLGIDTKQACISLKDFEGIYRRTQLIGTFNNISVVDDFAHNPAEVVAAIKSVQNIGKRVFAWFQPHGFGPLRFMHEELSITLAETLRENDVFYVSDVFYAGGTVVKDIQSDIVSDAIIKMGKNSKYFPNRCNVIEDIMTMICEGDAILLMGARDTSLSNFAKDVFNILKNK